MRSKVTMSLFSGFVATRWAGLFMTGYASVPRNSPVMEQNLCIVCQAPLTLPKRVYCSRECDLEQQRKHYERSPLSVRNATTVGMISELVVCADLMRLGYEVFRAVSAASSCDLAVLKDGTLKRVEVTTGHRKNGGKVFHCKKPSPKYDILAVVIQPYLVIYNPALEVQQ